MARVHSQRTVRLLSEVRRKTPTRGIRFHESGSWCSCAPRFEFNGRRLSFIGLVIAAGDVALSRTYGEAAPLRIGRFCGGGRYFRVLGFRGGSGRRRYDCSGRRSVGRVYIEPVFAFTGIFQPKLAAFHAGVRDLSGRTRAFESLSRKLVAK